MSNFINIDPFGKSSFMADKAVTQQAGPDKTSRHARETITEQIALIEQVLIANNKFYRTRGLYNILANQEFVILPENTESDEVAQLAKNRRTNDLTMMPPQLKKRLDELVKKEKIVEKKVTGSYTNKKKNKTLKADVYYYGPVNGEFDVEDSQKYANFIAKARDKDLITDIKKLEYIAMAIILVLKHEKKYGKDKNGIAVNTIASRTFDFKEPIIQCILDDFIKKELYTEELLKVAGLKYQITCNHHQKYLLTPSPASPSAS